MNVKFKIEKEDIKWIIDNEAFYYNENDSKNEKDKELITFSDYQYNDDEYEWFINKKHKISTKSNKYVKALNYRLGYIKTRYYDIQLDSPKSDLIDQNKFLEWWKIQPRSKDKTLKCYYCGCSETDYHNMLIKTKNFNDGCFGGRLYMSKKRNWKFSNLEIEEKIPADSSKTKNHSFTNCVFSCHICNNAESDLIHADDFLKYFGKAINDYIKDMGK